MIESGSKQVKQFRDGTSQQSRIRPALLPDYVAIEERSLKDLLAFVRDYAGELNYFDENNRENGNWQAFFPRDTNLDEVIAFIQNPKSVPESRAAIYRRPHFTLLLSFLQLLEHAKDHLNGLTQRHLDFYYQEFLQLKKKPARPDQLNVIVELAKHQQHFRLPAGTLLNADKDSEGKSRAYKTDKDVSVSQAQAVTFSSVYADTKRIGIQQARELYIKEHGYGGYQNAFLEMLKISHGQPFPGSDLPKFPGPGTQASEVNYDFLKQLHDQLKFVKSSLFMQFSDFKDLMRFKKQRQPTSPELIEKFDIDWQTINQLLIAAAHRKTGNSTFEITPANSTEFDLNLENALGILDFSGLTEVENITDLYHKRDRVDVQNFIKSTLFLWQEETDVQDSEFVNMMQIKVRIDGEWQRINTILEQAGYKKNAEYHSIEPLNSPDFDSNLEQLLGLKSDGSSPSEWPAEIKNIDELDTAINKIEQFFSIPAFEFSHMMDIVELSASVDESSQPSADQWQSVYSILTNAFQQNGIKIRQQKLDDIAAEKQGLDAIAVLLTQLLGKRLTADESLSALDDIKPVLTEQNFNELVAAANAEGIPVPDWKNIYRFLAIAWGVLKPEQQIPQKHEWQNLYAFEDATSATVSLGIDDDKTSRWETFGRRPVNEDEFSENLAEFGFALYSPILMLNEGQRIITLTLNFAAEQFDSEKIMPLIEQEVAPFKVVVSSEKGWLEPDTVKLISDSQNDKEKSLVFTITFNEDADPVTAPDPELTPTSSWPVLKILLRQHQQDDTEQNKTGRYFTHYEAFKDLLLLSVHIDVEVNGLSEFLIQNDDKVLDASKPFEPFGAKPVVGSHLYIAHAELAYKKITSLSFSTEWMNVPESVKSHYTNYDKIKSANPFSTIISLQDQKTQDSLINPESKTLLAEEISIEAITDNPLTSVYRRDINIETGVSAKQSGRYIQWELNSPDFQHTTYPALAAQKATQLAVDISAGDANTKADYYLVNPPYTPTIKKLTIDYKSSLSINLDSDPSTGQAEKIFHIHPFGYSEIRPGNEAVNHFIPQFDHEGELYIGIEKLDPPQNLSLLFQMAEGSANADLEPEVVHWSYLSANHWVSLDDGNVLSDSTRGLINSGVVEFFLKPAQKNTLLSPQLYWLRARINKHSNSVCDTVAIHTQAVSATFCDNHNAADHFDQPLAAQMIKKLIKPIAEIKAIHQPYTSFAGKPAEQEERFYTRISERLRHKNRALSQWDYEHLILEYFPQIYKVKCMPAILDKNNAKPGSVNIIVIPDIRNRIPFDPFGPKASADLIAKIEHFLLDKIPDSASVSVGNAYYIPVKIRMGIRFHSGYNPAYYKKELNTEINRFLSPWAYEKGADIVIGGKIYANSIINFVEQQPYIDYVTNIKLFRGSQFEYIEPGTGEGYSVAPEHPGSVLVGARQHEFDLISDAGYEEDSFTGINYMKIELDFQVA